MTVTGNLRASYAATCTPPLTFWVEAFRGVSRGSLYELPYTARGAKMSDQPLPPLPAEPLAHWPPDDAVQEEVAATLERVLQRVEKAAAHKELSPKAAAHKAVRKAVTAVLEGVLQRRQVGLCSRAPRTC